MSDRREYFRVRALARVRLRALAKTETEALRRTFHARSGPAPARLGVEPRSDEGAAREWRALEAALAQISLALERIERRLDPLEPDGAPGPVEISLSGAGFAGPFELDTGPDELVWAELELLGSGLPPISTLARAVPGSGSEDLMAFHFEEICPEDRERIVQLALRIQSQALRARREGEAG